SGAPPPPLFVGERFDHLFGDVDALARIHDGILQNQVELLGLRDLQDDLVRTLLESRELLVSPQVDVFAKFALPSLQNAREVREHILEGRSGRELKPLYPVAFLCVERYPVTELERTDGRAPGDAQTG